MCDVCFPTPKPTSSAASAVPTQRAQGPDARGGEGDDEPGRSSDSGLSQGNERMKNSAKKTVNECQVMSN